MEKRDNCKFCDIISGNIEDYKIWENERFVLLLDICPVKLGHCMLIPKIHVESIYDLDDNLTFELYNLARKMSKPILRYTGAKKIGLLIKGFSVQHAHLHLVPLNNENEDIEVNMPAIAKEQLEIIQEGLKREIEDFSRTLTSS